MTFSLAQLTRRVRNPRRSVIPLRPIAPPAVFSSDLYRAVYQPVVSAWEAAVPGIMAEYERTLRLMGDCAYGEAEAGGSAGPSFVARLTDSPADVERQIGTVADELSRLLLVLTPRLREWAFRVERWHRGKWRGAVLSATGVDLQTLIGPESARQTVEATIQWNVSLIKDVSEQARQRISSAVFSGLNQRKPAREVAKEVREAVAMGRRRSINIASEQLSKLSSALDTERMREAGIAKWKWMHSGKAHPREEHQARNGKVYTFAAPPADMPGELPYCGCRKLAVIDLD